MKELTEQAINAITEHGAMEVNCRQGSSSVLLHLHYFLLFDSLLYKSHRPKCIAPSQ